MNPDLVVCDKDGKPYSVRYDQVNAMLLNEFLKERKKIEDQQGTIAQLTSDATKQEAARIELTSTVAQQQKAMEILTAQLKEQAAQIQRVSAQLAAASSSDGGLELNKFARGRICRGRPAPQTVCLPAVALREGGNNPVKFLGDCTNQDKHHELRITDHGLLKADF